MLDIMLSDNELTRLRAATVLQGITSRMYGFVPDKGWPDAESEARWKTFWADMGNLRAMSGYEERRTRNEERNAPIKKLNDRFGYRPSVGRIYMRGPVR